ncbi:DUF2283 domain-containing protein [Nocardioides sp. PD653]|uniref:DUF2283 domain-containing protein n=1 Tax=Nocardioides sp. PD653 TaxID=393303 RepID=UPI0009F157AE|nr:DUF2283 domain-containing protein [Nocardioides sp. PD653]GAW54730.1 uncharacterized protein PD653_2144 [Nocardioides sp. PD653]
MNITIEVDTEARAAYIKLSDNDVSRTVAFDDTVQIDLDESGAAVGIEILSDVLGITVPTAHRQVE